MWREEVFVFFFLSLYLGQGDNEEWAGAVS
jgi:hypothetical protein